VDTDYHRWLTSNPENKCFTQSIPRSSALQHAAQLSAVERSYVAKYPGDCGTAIKAIAKELLDRLAAANGAVAASTAAAAAPAAAETFIR
jgi:chromosome partitioning protein